MTYSGPERRTTCSEHAQRLSVVETKIDDSIGPDGHLTKTMEHLAELLIRQNSRVDKLEGWRDKITGSVAILTVVVIPVAIAVAKIVFK